MNHLDGVQAVAYGRLRLMDTDFARTERQRKIIEQAFQKAKSADFSQLNTLIGTVFPQVATSVGVDDLVSNAKNISKYYIGETTGFPQARGDANLGSKGAVVVPQTLATNVTQLHQFLFGDEDYTPSATVQKISAQISADTGMYTEGTYIDKVSTEGYIPKQTEAATTAATTEAETEEETSTEVETDENGDPIETEETSTEVETDENGDPIETEETSTEVETDENGDPIETEEETSESIRPTSPYPRPDGTEEEESSATRPTAPIEEEESTVSGSLAPVRPGESTTSGSTSPSIAAPGSTTPTETTIAPGGPSISGGTVTSPGGSSTSGTISAPGQ